MTVMELIEALIRIEDKDQTIFYQYLLAEHTDLTKDEFHSKVLYVEDYAADQLSIMMNDFLNEVE